MQYDSGGFGGTPTLRLYVKRGQSSTAPDPLEVDAGDVAWLLGGGYLRRLQMLRSYDLRDRLGEIRVPVLLVASGRDRLVNGARCG